MIKYMKCSEVDMNLIFEAFSIGFSDYIIKLSMPKEMFVSRFFGAEGNSLEYSHIALDDDKAVGVVLGGIKVYEGIKTLRCGTLAVHPDYRGKGISQKLMELHREVAIENNCKQLFLEVIVGNDRAINFYKRLKYEKVYDLSYFSLDNLSTLKNNFNPHINIKGVSFVDFKAVVDTHKEYHINWQSDIDYVEKLETSLYYVAYEGENLIGYLCGNTMGKVNFIWVSKDSRCNGVGLALLSKHCNDITTTKLSITIPNNSLLEGFIKRIGFKRDSISQYEMYVTL
jgi:ribosomal protein S18 acetylase RimI-like enzyme